MTTRRSLLGVLAGLPFIGAAFARASNPNVYQRPRWDQICWLRLRNPSDEPITLIAIMPVAIPPRREIVIPARGSVGVNMQYASALEIGGVTIGPITAPDPRDDA